MRYWYIPSDVWSLYTTSQTSPALSSHAVMRLKKPKSLGPAVGLKRTRSPRLNVCGIIRPHSVDVRGSGVAGGEGAFCGDRARTAACRPIPTWFRAMEAAHRQAT